MTKCLVIDCHDPVAVQSRNLCERHWCRWRRHGAPDALVVIYPKCSAETVQAIRDAIATGEQHRVIAKQYGVSPGYVSYLRNTPDPRYLPCDLKGCTEQRVFGYLYCAAHRAPPVPTHTPTKDPDKCVARGCQRFVDHRKQRNLCWAHYMRWYRTGTPYGVGRRGNPRPATKLTDEQVRAIRHAFQQGATALQLAQRYPISKWHVYNLVAGRSRKDVV